MAPRFYCPQLPAAPPAGEPARAALEGDELHHLRTVRRLGAGDEVELFDGCGRLARCTLVRLDRRRAEVDVVEVSAADPPRVQLTIATAIPKVGRMDWLVEKATELGAWAVWPLATERGSVRAAGRQMPAGWRRRAVEAAKQCGRLWLPEIAEPASLDEALARCSADPPDVMLLADPSPGAASLGDVLSAVRADHGHAPRRSSGTSSGVAMPPEIRIVGFVGPEGGFTEEESARLRAAGSRPVRLAEHVLRVETAAVALAAAVAAHM